MAGRALMVARVLFPVLTCGGTRSPPTLQSLRKNICGQQTSSAQWNDLPGNHETMLVVEKACQREYACETQQRGLCGRHKQSDAEHDDGNNRANSKEWSPERIL